MRKIVEQSLKKSIRKAYLIFTQIFGGIIGGFLLLGNDGNYFLSVIYGILIALALFLLTFLVVFLKSLNGRIVNDFFPVEIDFNDTYPYYRNSYVEVLHFEFDKEKLMLNINSRFTNSIVSNIDGLPFITHKISKTENKAFRYENVKFNLDDSEYVNGEVRWQKTLESSNYNKWRISFNPKIRKNEKAKYTCTWGYRNARFLTLEELNMAKAFSLIPDNFINDSFTRSTIVPCKNFEIEINFPKGFPIFTPTYDVDIQGIRIDEEFQRIEKYFSFIQPNLTQGWKLKLSIENPLPNANYSIVWRPPAINDLINNNFINLDEKSMIEDRVFKEKSTTGIV